MRFITVLYIRILLEVCNLDRLFNKRLRWQCLVLSLCCVFVTRVRHANCLSKYSPKFLVSLLRVRGTFLI